MYVCTNNTLTRGPRERLMVNTYISPIWICTSPVLQVTYKQKGRGHDGGRNIAGGLSWALYFAIHFAKETYTLCKRDPYNMQKRSIQHAKETCNLIDPTHRSHPPTTTREPWKHLWARTRICKYIYICTLQVICIFTYVHTLIYMYVHTHARVGASFGSAIRSHTTKFSNSPAQVPSEMSSLSASRSKEPSRYAWYYVYVYICISICVCIYTYICVCIHVIHANL